MTKRQTIILGILLVLLVSPVAALPNLLNQSNQFWVWSGSGFTLAPNMTTNYDNSQRAWRINETTAWGNHYIYKTGNIVANTNYTWSLYAKEGSVRYIQLALGAGAFGATNYTNFDLHDCSIAQVTGTLSGASTEPNGWCRLRITSKSIATASSSAAVFGIRSPAEGRAPEYTGNINNYSYIFGGQLVSGDTIGIYNATFQPPEGNFTASAYTGTSSLSATLYDNTTPSEIVGWNWYAINYASNTTEYQIATTQNPAYTFPAGNWSVKLKASNYLFSGNSSSKWVNVSSEIYVYPIQDPINKTGSQYLPTTSITITPNTQVNLTAAKGEYESASFVLKSDTDVTGVNISTPTLTSGGNTIPASAIDIKILLPSWNIVDKDADSSWDYAGSYPFSCSERYLSNANIWHNETKFARNDAACSNYLLVRLDNGTEVYYNVSSTTDNIPATAIFDDSDTIQPFWLNASLNKQFWVTANISSSQATGNYSGLMSLTRPDGTYLKNITLNVRVLNFTLVDSTKQYSTFYVAQLTTGSKTSAFNKSNEVFASDIADMRKHGITHPFIWIKSRTLTDEINATLDFHLSTINQSGMPTDSFFVQGWDVLMDTATDPADIATRVATINYIKSRAEYYGFDKTYVYGIDEATEPQLSAQRTVWASVRLNGSYIFTSGNANQLYNVSDILDVGNLNGYNRTTINALHSYGHKALLYASPESGLPNPEIYRKNYGFQLYNQTFDGAGVWVWQRGWGDPWNNFDQEYPAEETFTVPMSNGSVYTLSAEGFREAADDNRYVATLISTDGGDSSYANTSVFSNISVGRLPVDIRTQIANQIEYDILNPPTEPETETSNIVILIINYFWQFFHIGRWLL